MRNQSKDHNDGYIGRLLIDYCCCSSYAGSRSAPRTFLWKSTTREINKLELHTQSLQYKPWLYSNTIIKYWWTKARKMRGNKHWPTSDISQQNTSKKENKTTNKTLSSWIWRHPRYTVNGACNSVNPSVASWGYSERTACQFLFSASACKCGDQGN